MKPEKNSNDILKCLFHFFFCVSLSPCGNKSALVGSKLSEEGVCNTLVIHSHLIITYSISTNHTQTYWYIHTQTNTQTHSSQYPSAKVYIHQVVGHFLSCYLWKYNFDFSLISIKFSCHHPTSSTKLLIHPIYSIPNDEKFNHEWSSWF